MIPIYNEYTVQLADRDIINAIQSGNKDAFEQVFHACYENLCQYACTIVKDMDEAEDIVQSMFLKIWEKREELTIQQSIRSYLFRAVYHQCINTLEHKVIKLKHQEYGLQQGIHASQQPEVFPEELSESIRAAIDELPEQCRNIFVMSRYEELRYAEIAKKLNISVNTIENQISKALRILRLKLKDSIF
ncbi:MAG TPA: RNA polymerase sigma-70 factor [Ohtaekwangia sp.]|uniref:RNA polymerase sigma-70 factor n=1 Tax=Ohtaekwangia sp. TaxID=2066019 RepID=UPI002F92301E